MRVRASRWPGIAALLLAAASAHAQGPVRGPDGVTAAIRRTVHDSARMVLERALADSAFPGAYAVIGNSRGIIAEHGVGRIDWKESAPRPNAHTLWDLASLSKVVGMTSAIMQLVERNRVELDAPVQRYLPDWTGPGKERVTVRHLLTHTSGLPAFKQYYKEATTPAEARRLFFATPLDTAPGVRMVYSDIGAWLLGQIVERVSEQRLDRYLRANVFGPLRMTETRYRPPASLRARIAPTEIDPWRGRHLRGEVHDENAFALGGISAHAGLFSSAHDLARFARAYLNGGRLEGARVFAAATVARFTARAGGTADSRALGWDTPTGNNSAGHRMSARAFGHTGFTGTSLWMDPEHDVFVILLTNRVNPSRTNTKIGRVRVALADAVMGALAGTERRDASAASPNASSP
jgi:serine-type D-Ala-D-Ala carboxypeptidase